MAFLLNPPHCQLAFGPRPPAYSAIAERGGSLLPGAIGPTQFAFLPGRMIDDNVRTVLGIIDWDKNRKDTGIYILFLDQERVYDRGQSRPAL